MPKILTKSERRTLRADKRRQEMLDYIIDYHAIYGYPPTVREITDDLKISSTSVTHYHLKVLEDEGKLIFGSKGSPRAMQVVGYRFCRDERERKWLKKDV